MENATTQKSLLFTKFFFFSFENEKCISCIFLSFLLRILSPRSLSLYKLRHYPTPGARFSNLKSRSFLGPSQNLNNESVGPS